MLNRLLIIIVVIFIITSTCGSVSADKSAALPFNLKWEQSKVEVRQTLTTWGHILKKLNNTLHFVEIYEGGYSASTHFTFNDDDQLYWIVIIGMCDSIACANVKFDTVRFILDSSEYKKLHSESRLKHIYYDVLTDSYIRLRGLIDRGKYIVLLEYEYGKVSSMKKYGK